MEIKVATANQPMFEPVEVTSKITSINLIDTVNPETNKVEQLFSIKLAILPEIKVLDKNGKETKATILRTPKQMLKDMDRMIRSTNINSIYQDVKMYALGRNATVSLTAYEKGALATVTENSSDEIKKGRKIGDSFPTKNGGFMSHTFLEIDFRREDRAEVSAYYATLEAQQAEEDLGVDP